MLEPYVLKGTRAVLRGEGDSNTVISLTYPTKAGDNLKAFLQECKR